MRITTVFACATTALLLACDQHSASSAIDPEVGSACFEAHRFTLPPGTQYEGIDRLTRGKVLIKIMDGVRVATIECALNPDGSLQ